MAVTGNGFSREVVVFMKSFHTHPLSGSVHDL